MIRLERGEAPRCLNERNIDLLTEKFKNTGESVWQMDELKKTLYSSSFGKCAFCECKLGEESKYMEVEHFRYKKKYKDDVVKWDNLLPACRRCNGKKHDHDVMEYPIVNPYEDSPPEHFYMRNYRLVARTEKGGESIAVLDLNNSSRVVVSRFQIGEALNDMLLVAAERLDKFRQTGTARSRTAFLNTLENLLLEAQPDSIYSATTATVLHSDDLYVRLVSDAKMCDLWSADLESLHATSLALSFNKN